MRAETDKLQQHLVRLAIDQDQVGFDVAVPMVFPVAGEGVVAMFFGERLVVGQCLQYVCEVGYQRRSMSALGFAMRQLSYLYQWMTPTAKALMATCSCLDQQDGVGVRGHHWVMCDQP